MPLPSPPHPLARLLARLRGAPPAITAILPPGASPAALAAARAAFPTLRLRRADLAKPLASLLRQTASPRLLLLAPGTVLSSDAAAHLGTVTAQMAYADEDRLAPDGTRTAPYRKPAWSIELALEQDLPGALCLFSRTLLQHLADEPAARLFGPLGGLHPLGDLALLAAPETIAHIPHILGHREAPGPATPTPASVRRALSALPQSASTPRLVPSRYTGAPRVQWQPREPRPLVSVIIPTKDTPDLLATCTTGLLERTDYTPIELLIADNGSTDLAALAVLDRLRADPRVRILPCPGPFNYSAINNQAVRLARGTVLALLNNDIDVTEPSWLAEMVGHALRPGVGAVGARLLFSDGRIQHAGIVGGVGRFEDGPGVAGHFGLAAIPPEPGHGGQFIHTREVLAVTGACMVLRRALFLEIGGFDEAHLQVALNDLDLCLRLREAGHRTIYTPFAELYHRESATRGPEDTPGNAERFRRECRTIRDRWGAVLDNDPFYNRAFSRFDHSFLLADPVIK